MNNSSTFAPIVGASSLSSDPSVSKPCRPRAKSPTVDPDYVIGLRVGASVGVLNALPVSNTGGKLEGAAAAAVLLNDFPSQSPVISWESSEQARIDTLTFSFSGMRFDADIHRVRVWLARWSGDKLTIGGNVATRYNGYRQCLQVILGSGRECPALGWLGLSDSTDAMRGRWCLHLTGAACEVLQSGDWVRLFDDLADYEGKITRIDLAVDELEGEHSVGWVRSQYESGGFNLKGRPPKYQFIQSSDGDTFYVGKRGSGKICRSYQKGCQLGDSSSSWVRHEVELRSSSRVIPLEVLVYPTRYFKGAYPSVFSWLAGGASFIKTFRAKHKIMFNQALVFAKRQVGRLVRYCSEVIGYSSEQIVEELQAESGCWPIRLFSIDDDILDLAWGA